MYFRALGCVGAAARETVGFSVLGFELRKHGRVDLPRPALHQRMGVKDSHGPAWRSSRFRDRCSHHGLTVRCCCCQAAVDRGLHTQHPQQQRDKKTRHGRMGVKDPHGPAGCPNNNATRKRAMDAWASRTRMVLQVAGTHDTHRMENRCALWCLTE